MKRLCLLFFFVLSLFFIQQTQAANYKLDNSKIDVLFNEASTVSLNALSLMASSSLEMPAQALGKAKDPLVAIVLDFFLGGLGIHRFYLGTETMTGIGYILTCGGIFGVVPLVDLIVLAINYDDISKYVDNPKFFMW